MIHTRTVSAGPLQQCYQRRLLKTVDCGYFYRLSKPTQSDRERN